MAKSASVQKHYRFVLTGETPLLMHMDNIIGTEDIKKWRNDPVNKQLSVAGDDRSPAWTWLTYCYHNNRYFNMSSDNLLTAIREGAAKVPTGNAKGDKSFKKLSQSGIVFDGMDLDFYCNGKQIPWEPFNSLVGNNDFNAHCDLANKYGFELFAKRAKVGTAKHVRVRPLFRNWEVRGGFMVIDEDFYGLKRDVLERIFTTSGMLCGLCDWRPGSKQSPGTFGKFAMEFEEIK